MGLRQQETKTVTVGDNTFYIRPFSAYKAANLSGQLATLITPMLSSLLPLVGSIDGGSDNPLDVNMENAAPVISGAFSSLSGDKVENLLRELLTGNKNISYENFDLGKTVLLTEDAANELFCTDIQDMYLLAFEVIKLNFNGFFKKLGAQFGSLTGILKKVMPSTENTES